MISSDQNSALVKIYKASLLNKDWKYFSNYCLKRESGLRKEAFKELDIFLQIFKSWINQKQLDFVKFLFPFFEKIESADYVAFPEPMKNYIQPILRDWCEKEKLDEKPFRWYGKYFQSDAHLLKAIELNPTDDLARITIINRWTYDIYFSVHHLPNGYIGEPVKDLELGEKIKEHINLLSTKDSQKYWTNELEEDLELVRNYIDWTNSGDTNFEEWGTKNNRKVGY